MRKVVVGCAGWSIPGRYRDLFADGDSGLAWYASRFPIVEINSSFYRPHQHATYARWAGSVPRGLAELDELPIRFTEVIDGTTADIVHATEQFLAALQQ